MTDVAPNPSGSADIPASDPLEAPQVEEVVETQVETEETEILGPGPEEPIEGQQPPVETEEAEPTE